MSILVFNRIEEKYILNKYQCEQLILLIKNKMTLDKFCTNYMPYKIENIYYDTSNNDLISKSIEMPVFKEKVRLRKYYNSNTYFLEVKKKAYGIVGKRRITLNDEVLNLYELDGLRFDDYPSLMAYKEIMYIIKRYDLIPKVYLSYDRLAFFSSCDDDLRLTIDSNIITRRENLSFNNPYGKSLLDEDTFILEIKSTNNFPLWLVRILSKLKIKSSRFSKYGQEYKKYIGD